MEAWRRYRGYILFSLVYLILFGGYVLYERRPQPEPLLISEPTLAPTRLVTVQVHVAGAVRQPGVYALPAEARLLQAIEAAGGLADEADAERLNLAERLRDGQRIYVTRSGATAPAPLTPETRSVAVGGLGPGSGLVNLNTATAAELDALPGIGPAYAERIIAYRAAHGPFRHTADLMQVQGIGTATYERIKALITAP
jgi:competence protein ComEA